VGGGKTEGAEGKGGGGGKGGRNAHMNKRNLKNKIKTVLLRYTYNLDTIQFLPTNP
jgi:hypothetical protein